MSSSSRVKRTYASRQTRPAPPSSPPSDRIPSSPPVLPKRVLSSDTDSTSPDDAPAPKRRALQKPSRVFPASGARANTASKPKDSAKKPLTQLHFTLDTTTLRTCKLCGLSYTRAAPDDETLHKAHCARVQRGMEWGREEERERGAKAGSDIQEVAQGARLKDGRVGRILCIRMDIGGKIGTKLKTLLETVNLSLSSPPLTPAVLKASKAYVFLLPSPSTPSRERIAGCVIAQRIESAMAIASSAQIAQEDAEFQLSRPPTNASSSASAGTEAPPRRRTLIPVHIDPTTSLYVHPAQLPCALGVPRLFVSSAHRRQGIALHLLKAAADTFIHACPLDPAQGDIAFTQPTQLGRSVMDRWGQGGIRIYEE